MQTQNNHKWFFGTKVSETWWRDKKFWGFMGAAHIALWLLAIFG